MNSKNIITITVVLIILAGMALVFTQRGKKPDASTITNFEQCKAAGYPIMESYPEQCATPDGRTFINEAQSVPSSGNPNQTSNDDAPITANGCAVAGCSRQLCVSAAEAANTVSTCEYRAEYACYKEAACELQADGKCGWTETAELRACLSNPPAIDSSAEQVY